jgi:CO dehydrogenase/acetyl-CoA synthase alpha subunit
MRHARCDRCHDPKDFPLTTASMIKQDEPKNLGTKIPEAHLDEELVQDLSKIRNVGGPIFLGEIPGFSLL